jgi:hypothetical protein
MDIKLKISDTPTHYFSRSTTLVNSPPEKVASGTAHHYARIASALFCVLVVGWGDGGTFGISRSSDTQ